MSSKEVRVTQRLYFALYEGDTGRKVLEDLKEEVGVLRTSVPSSCVDGFELALRTAMNEGAKNLYNYIMLQIEEGKALMKKGDDEDTGKTRVIRTDSDAQN